MPFLHNIRTVSLYEAKTLRRSWFFRLFSLGALFILTIMNIAIFLGDEEWEMMAVSSTLPLLNLYMLNIGQAMVVIFLAADFLKRDKKLDTNEVLYTRSMSNFEYITGKTLGILRLFLGLNLVILSIGLLVNIIARDMKVDLMAYLTYLLLISIPTLVFSLGLAFMLMQIIRNQAITFMLLLGYAALNMFYLWFRAGSILDYMAFGLPLFKSDITGIADLDKVVWQRLLYFSLGMSMVMGTVLLFKRLPQSRSHSVLSVIMLAGFTGLAGLSGFRTWSDYKSVLDDKSLAIETNRNFEDRQFPTVTEALVDVEHKGEIISASASLSFTNDNNSPLQEYLFSLNPSLGVSAVTSAGKNLNFTRSNHIIAIDPGRPLEAGESDSVKIEYSGSINEAYCYPDMSGNSRDNPYRVEMLNIRRRQSFLTGDYVLLTPETHWYPVAGLNFYPSNPARLKVDFTRYTLQVKTRGELAAVSQGTGNLENGSYVFKPEEPLTGLTLAIGKYMTDTLTVDSVRFINYHYPGNDYYKKDLSEIKDTLPHLISGIMRDLETNFTVKYPFSTLSLLEVPVQFASFDRRSTQTRAEVQPSMVLVPERFVTVRDGGFYRRIKREKKRMAREGNIITDKELQVRIFNTFISNTFISGENFRYVNGVAWNEPTRYRLGPSFFFFRNNFYSEEYPVINAVVETHLQKVTDPNQNSGFSGFFGSLSENDRANIILKEQSFSDILERNPGGDTLRTVMTLKGDYIFNLLRANAGIGEFNSWFRKYLEENSFKRISLLKFNEEVNREFGFEFYNYLEDWFNGVEKPGFLFSDLRVREVIVDDRTRYYLTVNVSNPEKVSGLFNFSVRTGESGSGPRGVFSDNPRGGFSVSISFQGRGMEADDISRIIFMNPGEVRKIAVILDSKPREIMINTLVSKNIPGQVTLPVTDIQKSRERAPGNVADEILEAASVTDNPGEITVDNEDPGFARPLEDLDSPLKKILGVSRNYGDNYEEIRIYNAPVYWQPAVKSEYFGKYVLSSVYTRAGTGDRSVKWTAPISKAGFYDIYCFVGKPEDQLVIANTRSSGDQEGKSPYQDMHYRIYHDEGMEEITLDYENAESGWNNLGRYFLSPDSATVELTNQSAGRLVIGDAIKWVLQE